MQMLDELYHEDKGFNHSHTVFLSPQPPSRDILQVRAGRGGGGGWAA
jgi:hypothetical protein